MEYKFYNTGYISKVDKKERQLQNIDMQKDPLRNILGRCINTKKEEAGCDKDINDVPNSTNGWTNFEKIKSTKNLNWDPASGWSNGYDKSNSKEFFEINTECKNISINEPPVTNPIIFGPKLWFSFHNMAKVYPDFPTDLVKIRMKNIILGIPYLLPCNSCFEHSIAYLDDLDDCKLNDICSCRKNLIIFFVDFHNYVNAKLGKSIYKLTD
jgi:hypothetical protein